MMDRQIYLLCTDTFNHLGKVKKKVKVFTCNMSSS